MSKTKYILILAVLIVVASFVLADEQTCVDQDDTKIYEITEEENPIIEGLDFASFSSYKVVPGLSLLPTYYTEIKKDVCDGKYDIKEGICATYEIVEGFYYGPIWIPTKHYYVYPYPTTVKAECGGGECSMREIFSPVLGERINVGRCTELEECLPEKYGDDCEARTDRERRRECVVSALKYCGKETLNFPATGITGKSIDGKCTIRLKPTNTGQVTDELTYNSRIAHFKTGTKQWLEADPTRQRQKKKYFEETLHFYINFNEMGVDIEAGGIYCTGARIDEAIGNAAINFIVNGNTRAKQFITNVNDVPYDFTYNPYSGKYNIEVELYHEENGETAKYENSLGCENFNVVGNPHGTCDCMAVEDKDRDANRQYSPDGHPAMMEGKEEWYWVDCSPEIVAERDYFPDDSTKWRNPHSTSSDTTTSSQSTYMTREIANFDEAGIAYQFLPSKLNFNVPVQLTLLHNGNSFASGSGIGMYRYEDDDIESFCVLDEKASTSKTITTSGGIINLQDATLTIPANALSESTELTIRKVELICDYNFENLIPKIKKYSNNEISESTINEIINRWISTVTF